MKIEAAAENTNLKAKIEKFYQNETSTMFQDLLKQGLISMETMPQSFFQEDDFSVRDFLSSNNIDIKNLKASYKYDCLTMDRDDAMFFANSIKGENYSFSVNGEVLMQNMANDVQSVAKTYKSAEVSKTLMDMLSNSQQTNKPVRIDFGNDISAILRVTKDGKISAEFIPSDKAAEEYLRNNISYLERTFNEQNIPYAELSYRNQKKNNQSQNKQRSDKDGKGEE
ncbi:MAG: hypothetical protein K6C94_00035 [Candidatus Gastranaerophilales bacterium]|nr:hypothetical protein [Candidatus Gastranaerophilales bacterium]